MEFQRKDASILIPDGCDLTAAWNRITHLGIGAHPDDLEFMALHGILACYEKSDAWFGGVTCTNGAGSAQGDNAQPESALIDERRREQDEAARIGKYSIMAQFGYASSEAKNPADSRLTDDLAQVFQACRPHTVYTHNPADKHETHVAVLQRVLTAIKKLPSKERPRRLLGSEVWRDLDWMNDEEKVQLDVGGNAELAEQLANCFTSQMKGGKRYDLAVRGRERANATFTDSHSPDAATHVWFAMDLTPLIASESLSLAEYVGEHIDLFKKDVLNKLGKNYE